MLLLNNYSHKIILIKLLSRYKSTYWAVISCLIGVEIVDSPVMLQNAGKGCRGPLPSGSM